MCFRSVIVARPPTDGTPETDIASNGLPDLTCVRRTATRTFGTFAPRFDEDHNPPADDWVTQVFTLL